METNDGYQRDEAATHLCYSGVLGALDHIRATTREALDAHDWATAAALHDKKKAVLANLAQLTLTPLVTAEERA